MISLLSLAADKVARSLAEDWRRMFGARITVDIEEEGLRHAFIEVGPHTVLHPFQVPGVAPPGQQPMFSRGRLYHFALNTASEKAFREVRQRLVDEGASDGSVTDHVEDRTEDRV